MRACTRIPRDDLSLQCSSRYRRGPSWYVFHKGPIRATMTRCVRIFHCWRKSGCELHAEHSGSFVTRSVRTEQSTAVVGQIMAEAAGSFKRISLGKIGKTFKIKEMEVARGSKGCFDQDQAHKQRVSNKMDVFWSLWASNNCGLMRDSPEGGDEVNAKLPSPLLPGEGVRIA